MSIMKKTIETLVELNHFVIRLMPDNFSQIYALRLKFSRMPGRGWVKKLKSGFTQKN